MHNFVAKIGIILESCKQFAGNHVNEKGNIPRRGIVPAFSDIEVVALSITAEAFSISKDESDALEMKQRSQLPQKIKTSAKSVMKEVFNEGTINRIKNILGK